MQYDRYTKELDDKCVKSLNGYHMAAAVVLLVVCRMSGTPRSWMTSVSVKSLNGYQLSVVVLLVVCRMSGTPMSWMTSV